MAIQYTVMMVTALILTETQLMVMTVGALILMETRVMEMMEPPATLTVTPYIAIKSGKT